MRHKLILSDQFVSQRFSPCVINFSSNKKFFLRVEEMPHADKSICLVWLRDSSMKNEQQRQNLLLKVDPRSTFRNNFFNSQQMLLIVARQVDHARCKARNLQRNNVARQVEGLHV